jgi:hypothetical protein
MNEDAEGGQGRCPYCRRTDGCSHLLLMVDTTFRRAEGGTLMDAFNVRWSKIFTQFESDPAFDECAQFDALLSEVNSMADAMNEYDYESGPGSSFCCEFYFVSAVSRARKTLKSNRGRALDHYAEVVSSARPIRIPARTLMDITWGGRIRKDYQSRVWKIAKQAVALSTGVQAGSTVGSIDTQTLRFLDGGVSWTKGKNQGPGGMRWFGEHAKAHILYRLGLDAGKLLHDRNFIDRVGLAQLVGLQKFADGLGLEDRILKILATSTGPVAFRTSMLYQFELVNYWKYFREPIPDWVRSTHPRHRYELCELSLQNNSKLPPNAPRN